MLIPKKYCVKKKKLYYNILNELSMQEKLQTENIKQKLKFPNCISNNQRWLDNNFFICNTLCP